MTESVPSRRQVMGGALAAAGLVVFPVGVAGARPSRTGQAATAVDHDVPVGVTLDMSVFPRGTSRASGMTEWAKVTGCQPLATKVYLNHRQFPTNLGNDKIRWCAQTGATAVLCYSPSFSPLSKSDAAALAHSVTSLKAAGLHNAVVVLWTEPCGQRKVPAAAFQAGFRFYGSAARAAGWPLYSCMNGSHQNLWAAYTSRSADGYAVDDYASRGNWKAIWGPGGLATMADRDGKKFGWFEMGASASKPVSQSTVTAYLTDARNYLASRRPGTTGPCIWYNGSASQPGGLANTIVPTGHRNNGYIVTLYRQLYQAVAG